MSTVFGLPSSVLQFSQDIPAYASRKNAAVQPFIRKPGPSCFNPFTISLVNPCFASPFTEAAFCSLLFKTSAGAHTVVATVPAITEAVICTGTPSES